MILMRAPGLGCRVPDQMRARLRSLLGPSGMVLRQSHLVKFFDAWRAGDYTSAFDNIHRYYDYAMQTREKIHYQYALLHMAILQAEFGCFSEAIAAINETISTARENQDMTCLNFSLSWLHHMANAYPKQMKGSGYRGMLGSERDGLTFLKTKAKESKMYSLLSATLLSEAKLYMSTVSVPPPFGWNARRWLIRCPGRIGASCHRADVPGFASQHQGEYQQPWRTDAPAVDAVFPAWNYPSFRRLLRPAAPLLWDQLSRRRAHPGSLQMRLQRRSNTSWLHFHH